MNTKHSTSFTVYPDMCNYMAGANEKSMVHGGYMLMMMDRVAAECCRRLLYDAKPVGEPINSTKTRGVKVSQDLPKWEIANSALTVNVTDVTFYVGATLGDIIFLNAEVVKLGNKRIEIQVVGERENNKGERQKICDGKFTFCAMWNAKHSVPHGLRLENEPELGKQNEN